MTEPTLKGKLAKELLEQFPEAPTLTLAKILHRDYSELFLGTEDARDILRYYRGAHGQGNASHLADTRFVRPAPETTNPFPDLPEGITEISEWTPYLINESRTLVIADLHVPYHDRPSLEIALSHAESMSVTGILLLGDIHDMFACSFWEKDPKKRDFQRELSMGRGLYAHLRARFPDIPIRMKIGNHEERYFRYMQVKAPEVYGVDSFEFETIFHMRDHGIEVIGDRRVCKIGKLHLVHGHEFGRSVFSPVNPARGYYLRAKDNCLGAHYHAASQHVERTIGEKQIGCWSVACLCDLHPYWKPINTWSHGFAVVDNLGEGQFHVHNHTIIEGKVY